jgi:hypothetical protein
MQMVNKESDYNDSGSVSSNVQAIRIKCDCNLTKTNEIPSGHG